MMHDDIFGEPGKETEIHVNDDGLADDVEELRGMVHDLACMISMMLDLPIMSLVLPDEIYENIETMAVMAHAVVCPETAKKIAEMEVGEEIPVPKITAEEKATSESILSQVFGEGYKWQFTQEPGDSK